MADMLKYGNAYSHLSINGLDVTESDLGETDPPITIEDIEPRGTLKRGTGGGAVRIDNVTRAKRLTVNLLPGGTLVRQLIAIEKTGVDFEATWSQQDTNETIHCVEGIITNRGPLGRAGRTTVTDEQFIFEFNDSEET